MSEVKEISVFEKQYADEWLLIEVTETNDADYPLKGKLLGHSKSRQDIHQIAMATRVRGKRYQLKFTGNPIPPDMVYVL